MKVEQRTGDAGTGAGTREAILDATEQLMVEHGYAAVTSRRVAERAGLKSQLVHYYFRTMDDLFVTVYERAGREFHQRHLEAASADNPLRALWELSINPRRMRLSQELIALASHRAPMRRISVRVLEQMHAINEVFIGRYIAEAGVDPEEFPPAVISHLINALSRSLVNEEVIGISRHHSQVHAFVERWLDRIEAKRREAAKPLSPHRPS